VLVRIVAAIASKRSSVRSRSPRVQVVEEVEEPGARRAAIGVAHQLEPVAHLGEVVHAPGVAQPELAVADHAHRRRRAGVVDEPLLVRDRLLGAPAERRQEDPEAARLVGGEFLQVGGHVLPATFNHGPQPASAPIRPQGAAIDHRGGSG
jgi:hypothetical protein